MPVDSGFVPILRRSAVQNIELVTKNEDFGLQCRPRPE